MPRVGTQSLLKVLNAAGVRRYVREGTRIEVEFWAPPGVQVETTREDRREKYLEERQRKDFEGKQLRDPLAVATEDLTIDDEGTN
jgi:hypothetical protein